MGRFPLLGEATLHETELYKINSDGVKVRKYGRGILQATFDIWGEPVTILANHWPSQGNPDYFRDLTAQTMRKISAANPVRAMIAAGDFNSLPTDVPNGLDNWVTQLDFTYTFDDPLKQLMHELQAMGTYWYRGRWSHLDRIFIWNYSYSSLRPLWDTFQILAFPWMLRDLKQVHGKTKKVKTYTGIPKRFNSEGEGYSDHLPVAMKFELIDE